MTWCSRSFVFLSGLLVALAAGGAAPASAACPEDVCDCVGEAKNFNLVAEKRMQIIEGFYNAGGYVYPIETFVDGHVCAPKVLLSGPADHGSTVYDLLATSGPQSIAARFRSRDPYRTGGYGAYADDVITGGGIIRGESVLGASSIDTTGTSARVPQCRQAILDMQSASATLAALTPTMSLGTLTVRRGEYIEIDVGPGVQVIDADRITITPRRYNDGYASGASLDFRRGPDTTQVIVNTRGLFIGELSNLTGADIVNVVGTGTTVRVLQYGYLEAPLLAPQRRVDIGLQLGDFAVGSIMARAIRMRGSTAFNSWTVCP